MRPAKAIAPDAVIPAKAQNRLDAPAPSSRHSRESGNPWSFPRYPKYKDSGVAWLGEVPVQWNICQLRRLLACKLANGIFKRKDDFGRGTLLVNVFDAYRPDFKVDFGSLGRVHCDEGEQHSYAVGDGDILFVRSSLKVDGIAAAVLITQPQEAVVFECHLIRARVCATSAVPRFVAFLLASNQYRDRLVSLAKITTMTTIEQESLCSLPVLLPSVAEQTHIAAFLDREISKIDTLIAEQEKLIVLLKEKRQALISHAVTKGLDPNAPMKNSGIEWLGQVPAHWMMKRLKRISPFITVGIVVNPSNYVADEGLPFIYGGDISEGSIASETARRISPQDSQRNAKTKLQAGDVLTVRVGAPGVTAVAGVECEGGNCASVMLTRRGDYDSRWLCFAMNSRMVRYQVEIVQYGAAQEQFNISHAINFWFATPSKTEQTAIADVLTDGLEQIDKLKLEAQHAIALLKERRSALISAAVTGKIDVRNAA